MLKYLALAAFLAACGGTDPLAAAPECPGQSELVALGACYLNGGDAPPLSTPDGVACDFCAALDTATINPPGRIIHGGCYVATPAYPDGRAFCVSDCRACK